MLFIPFLLAIPGAISGTLALSHISPWEVSNRITPLMLILMALLMMFLPIRIEMALAVMPIAAYLAARFRFAFTGHEAADWSPAWTVPKEWAKATYERIKPREPVVVHDFLGGRSYPAPEWVADHPRSSSSSVDKYVPEL